MQPASLTCTGSSPPHLRCPPSPSRSRHLYRYESGGHEDSLVKECACRCCLHLGPRCFAEHALRTLCLGMLRSLEEARHLRSYFNSSRCLCRVLAGRSMLRTLTH